MASPISIFPKRRRSAFSPEPLLNDEDELELEEEDELDPQPEAEAPPLSRGRLAMGRRARRAMRGEGSEDDRFSAGVQVGQANAFSNGAAFGGLIRGTVRLIGSAAQGLTGTRSAAELAREVGVGIRSGVGLEDLSGRALGEEIAARLSGPTEPVQVEATAEELPPVYIADDQTFSELDLAEEDLAVSEPMELQETFGASCRYGRWSEMPRARARDAYGAHLEKSSRALRRAPAGTPSVFVHEAFAAPVLRSSGEIYDAVYGRMTSCPCPSCSSVSSASAKKGRAGDCGVCDGFGAVLVPETDLEAWPVSYGGVLLGLLGLGATAAPALLSRTEWGQEKLEELRARTGAQDTDQVFGRAIAPRGHRSW